ncbi:hypothetical protein NQ317_000848 [Molorchus minor]|uniref:Uncharacterized protein n=1 Tax=Molorchus minor TaxID=1323400 RepID=A0ABQ9JWE7_9CUCU|nr:hypothetical protein NQ317_000848 [Molorchus minor]
MFLSTFHKSDQAIYYHLFQEQRDEVFDLLERKKKETLAHKRSFFVRMVSDPKIYNPSIAKSLTSTRRHLTQPSESPDHNITVQPPTSASWISWPLAFLFQGITEDGASSDVPIRFRHLDTKVRLKTTGKGSNGGSPSPEGENSRSPKRSPVLSRKTTPSPEFVNRH